jgi:NADPH:quinone reductase-like Zn-dependent oxidoreductase
VKAIGIEAFGGPERLRPMALPRPHAGKGEILIRVVSAGVSRPDACVRSGALPPGSSHRFPLVPGWDAAGVVEELGDGATRFRKGDRVWACARKPLAHLGTYAEYVAVPEGQAALMPAKLLFEEAAAVPVAALSARQVLSAGGSKSGATVYVHEAASGIGQFVVQLARLDGARVLAAADGADLPFVLGLGCEVGIDLERDDVRASVARHTPRGVDLVVDAAGDGFAGAGVPDLATGGKVVTMEWGEPAAVDGVPPFEVVTLVPSGEQLEAFGRLFDRKRLAVHVQTLLPLARAADAHRALESSPRRSRLVLNL